MCILYMADPADAEKWRVCLSRLAPELEFRQWPDIGNPAEVHYILAWEPLANLAEQFGNLRLIYAAGAGVDQFDLALLPADVSLIRLVDSSMADIMAEYVLFGVLALHRDILAYQADQRSGRWQPRPIVHATQRRVGVMGVGNLGRTALDRLQPLGFQLSGWNRSLKEVPGGRCYVGTDELEEFLGQCDILVNMLPLTPETDGILNAARLDCLPHGAGLINVGRGAHVVETALLSALNEGRLGGAVLDVQVQEPPTQDNPLWKHPRVLLTPHIASDVPIEGGVAVIVENLRRECEGMPLLNVVDRSKGY
ncbi:glyoxylate/hydroxypyruvate reductase A [Pseudomonas sp. Root329]|uniref:2-hydroxyacid dehydrogenase n=1 Tax=Pseudomonas sp. Root329 TaxID=1736515 RepID=UPI000700BE14|nr:glyoxylate/hydroxypyruvate reductase A [Pseudomonas sp. Root329]KQV18026.1 glyoxylate/hydroxypyruvate reductase A [Pseudomonas sp. Root329]